MLQATAYKLLTSGANVFVTGPAGAGKTHLLNRYIKYLRAHKVATAITASTGIAATHIGGTTIHSWSGLGILKELAEKDLKNIAKRRVVRQRIRKTQVLIIDEISMLAARTLQCIDEILRYIKVSPKPFGGVQVVFCGDFFQLPPVDKEGLPAAKKLAFMAEVWRAAELKPCYLSESHRHADDQLLSLLNAMRHGDDAAANAETLAQKIAADRTAIAAKNAVNLYTHNIDVDAVNAKHLAQIKGKEKTYTAEADGPDGLVEGLKKSILAPPTLKIKAGAKVMFVKNNPDENYMNGTLGEVVEFNSEDLPVVATADNKIIARVAEWNIDDENGLPIASYRQIPLRLAWAITIHKSQGMTLESAAVDLSKTFEPGQGYVALSRVKTWGGLHLIGCNDQALAVEPLVRKADIRFRELSKQAADQIKKLTATELKKVADEFIKKSRSADK